MAQAFKEFTAKKLQREERPSIRKDIAASKEKAAARNADRPRKNSKKGGCHDEAGNEKTDNRQSASICCLVYLFGKLGQAYRLAEGIDLSQKLLHFADGCAAAFESAAPSFHPTDLLIGVAGAAALRLMVYCKGKNAKKYRKGVEYGSARWGGPKDIAPYIDPQF